MTWQDITSAPKRQLVLVCDRHGIRRVASQLPSGGWMSIDNDMLEEPPTHWCELPDPPSKRE